MRAVVVFIALFASGAFALRIPGGSRRAFMKQAPASIAASVVASSAFGISQLSPQPAGAVVYHDPNVYGDAENKVAVINRCRQRVRDAIIADPSLGPSLFLLGLADSLKYNAATGEGGGDGTITKLAGEKSPAATFVLKLRKELLKTTQLTLADIVAVACAEAYETFSGGIRVRLQIGRLGGDKATTAQNTAAVLSLDWSDARDVISNFQRAGLSEKEVAVLDAVRGGMLASAAAATKNSKNEEVEVNEMGETDFVPNTSFGGAKEIFGAGLPPFDDKYVQAAVKAKTGVYGADDKVQAAGLKLSIKNGKEGAVALEKVLALGKVYTGGKIGDLIGS